MSGTRGKEDGVEDKIEKEEREHLIATISLAREQSQNTLTVTPSTQFSLDESRISVGRRIDFDDIERQERQHLLGSTSLDHTLHKNVDDAFKRLLRESRTAHMEKHNYSARDFSASTTSPHRPLATPLVHSPSYPRYHRPYSDAMTQKQNILNDLHLRYGVKPVHPEDHAMELSLRYAPLYNVAGKKLKPKPRSALRQLLKNQQVDSMTVGIYFYFIYEIFIRVNICFLLRDFYFGARNFTSLCPDLHFVEFLPFKWQDEKRDWTAPHAAHWVR